MSSRQARGFHSITIGEKNTWDDWHLVPTSRPFVAPPGVRTSYMDLPYADGALDLTTNLQTKPVYGNRSGSWEFLVINPGQIEGYYSKQTWAERYSHIMAYLHGKQFDVILDDEPDYFYTGTLSVDSWDSRKDNSVISISYSFDPYKRKVSNHNSKKL